MEHNILVGGAAGQGMDTVATILEKTLKRSGFYVFSNKDYMSRVRGGHNFTQIRFSTTPIYSHSSKLDVIIALDSQTIQLHENRLVSGGKIICDEKVSPSTDNIIALPLAKIAADIGNPRVINTVATGALLKLFGIPMLQAERLLSSEFSGAVLDANIQALNKGYDAVSTIYELDSPGNDDNIFINGNQAIALGAIAAGCRYYCGYPMTPSTSLITYMAQKSNQMGIVVEQVEDEIAAINMALGASYAGVRAMTGSSGGGFALMVEGVSLAGITETPIVIAEIQRPGPATGFPTRTEQSDLRFIIHAGHGEFPKMVIAVRNPEDAFYQTARAFNLAEKYQIPVILVSDQYLADYAQTIKPFDFSRISIDRYLDDGSSIAEDEKYKRYKLTDSGISPRLIPGSIKGQVIYVDSDEHDEYGHITESAEIRTNMVNKRLKKEELLRQELIEPELLGDDNPEILIVSWGSLHGPLKEAIDKLVNEGISIGALVFGDIWPFPTKRLTALASKARLIVDLEQNATAQLDGLIRQEALISCDKKLLKYDGRIWSPEEIYDRLKGEVLDV
ncbi:2-oxoacid:acceptor oxidoreductase subunit alpha [Mahella australiensis]|uniref:Pyruvate flavodoxin/ferredoxin oxidoreductase domain protein n=1 Tax=Mahella australiensis (strain DSM 15567 / CIP 107919 / 50-1 BON) TaxID=697281 RepID=F4A027_MAHA5|nr:2-oxoacid:acceptor oxidoreductase subunit alpha [Mahella australiensis]AEE95845.1 pyruvate flavodoxin/ferredoxin oxidoreductase domain protein [Mahella australiensis 50-1 BON]